MGLGSAVLGLFAVAASTVRVGPGVYRPLYPPSSAERDIPVKAFLLDRLPITDGDFLAFVRGHPEWRRDRVPRVFADEGYLSHWDAPDALGPAVDERQPVVRVSWFAAKAYCGARGARLATEAEWELAASGTSRAQILSWYARPDPAQLPRVGSTPANRWGVQDLHGVVWEWVLDFDSSMIAADVRGFCGAGALEAIEKDDYPTFMRVAFRSSLRADYTTHNLGFRCAADIDERGNAR